MAYRRSVFEKSKALRLFFVPNSEHMSVEVNTDHLNRILRDVDGDFLDVVKSVGFSIERVYKTTVPVDTGATKSSAWTKTPDGGRAPEQWEGVTYVALPEPGPLEVIVGPTTDYAINIEFGTNRMAARPILTQAVEQVANDLERHIRSGARDALEGR